MLRFLSVFFSVVIVFQSRRNKSIALLASLGLSAIALMLYLPRVLSALATDEGSVVEQKLLADVAAERNRIENKTGERLAAKPVNQSTEDQPAGEIDPNQSAAEDSAPIGQPAPPRPGGSFVELDKLLEPKREEPKLRPIPEKMKQTIAPHKHPLDSRRITPGNFEYRGAFRLPQVEYTHKSRFAFGGFCLAFREGGDPDGPDDGYPGSLFTVGHDQHQFVAEISIPKPRYLVDKRGFNLLPAKILQDFSDVSDGFIESESAGTEPFKIGGLYVAGDRLHWTLYKFYNVNGTRYDSHATSSLNIATPKPEGLWHLGDMHGGAAEWHSYKNAGYIFDVPPERVDDLGGLNLISGLQISTGRQTSSQGPAMYAYKLPARGTASGSSLEALPLIFYPLGGGEMTGHNPADHWRGGAWLKVGRKEGIVIVGRKSLGEEYYGPARQRDCTVDKGYHGSPYEPHMLFYDVNEVFSVANAKKRPWMVEPYLRWGRDTPGGSLKEYLFDTCHGRVTGLALDRKRQLLYLIQYAAAIVDLADPEKYPVVHVFKLKDV